MATGYNHFCTYFRLVVAVWPLASLLFYFSLWSELLNLHKTINWSYTVNQEKSWHLLNQKQNNEIQSSPNCTHHETLVYLQEREYAFILSVVSISYDVTDVPFLSILITFSPPTSRLVFCVFPLTLYIRSFFYK